MLLLLLFRIPPAPHLNAHKVGLLEPARLKEHQIASYTGKHLISLLGRIIRGHGIATTDGTEVEVFVLRKLKDRISTTMQMSVWAAGTTNTIAKT